MSTLLEKKFYPQVQVLESWLGGPLAEFCKADEKPHKSWGMMFDPTGSWKDPEEQRKRGFKGALVCGTCRKPSEGLYEPKPPNRTWECEGCRNPRTRKEAKNG